MKKDTTVIRMTEKVEGKPRSIMFFCPACRMGHGLNDTWEWNGSWDKPTFAPSVLVRGVDKAGKDFSCHSYIRGGKIEFLSDSTHALAGKTVSLETF